jgi:UDP-glucuronate 4-epimerase
MRILITGAAGFIGSTTAHRLLDRGDEVIGIDDLNDYYDVNLKKARLARLQDKPGFSFHKIDIADASAFKRAYQAAAPQRVIHLAAQAGVRYSLENPQAYVDANITGFLNVLEAARHFGCDHLVFASTSSVYGSHTNMPFSVHGGVDHPVSLYAATKKSNELMAHTYAHLFDLPVTGLRFFTVYGPWGRPDMALFLFTKNILAGEPIDVFNQGNHTRDFTYIDDIVEGVVRACDRVAQADASWDPSAPDPASSKAPYRLYNIGSNNPVNLSHYIEVLEQTLGIQAKRNLLPLQPGDVPDTAADVSELVTDMGYHPQTQIETGIANFVAWYRSYYKV